MLQEVLHMVRPVAVQDIMVSLSELWRADTKHEAKKFHEEFDIVPLPKKGQIQGFFSRADNDDHEIRREHLISSDTSLLDLISLFENRYFYFVISANEISGYVHLSDLNHPYVRIPFFGLIQVLERSVWSKIEGLIDEEGIAKATELSVKKILKEREKNKRERVDLGWTGIFTFPKILRLANYYGALNITEEQIDILNDVRNRLAHSDRNLIDTRADISHVSMAQNLSLKLLRSA